MKVLVFALGIALLEVGCAGSGTPRRGADRPVACEALRTLALPHVEIASARVVAAQPAAYCRVDAIARPTADSEIRFEVAIPAGAAWNGRYVQVGNGGFAGLVPENDVAAEAARGNASAGTDDGHASTRGINAEWALGHPEKVIDFGYRAVKETHDAALAIIGAYTGRAPRVRYFTGCSDGGREGFMEAQRYPGDFDGIVVIAPAYHAVALLADMAWNELALLATPASWIPPAKLPAIERAALAACGDADGVIEDPLACRFDPSVLRCTAADANDCLTDAQVAALAKIYAGPIAPSGARIFTGLAPGAEAEPGSWEPWITGTAAGDPGRAAQLRFAETFFRYMVRADPQFDLRTLRFDNDVALARARVGATLDADNPDMSAFAAHGGKLLHVHGWNDQVISPRDSIAFHDAVVARAADASRFYRLFMVPGMLHCDGGRGPSSIPTERAIEAWVEAARAPDSIAAPPSVGTRPWTLCPYPQRSGHDGCH